MQGTLLLLELLVGVLATALARQVLRPRPLAVEPGIASEQWRDVAAWIGVAEAHGFSRVFLVGHSAG